MTIKAEIADVMIGSYTIPGLMSENGDLGVAVPQIAVYFQIDKAQASRELKRLAGSNFNFCKWQSPLNPKPVNVVLLQDMEQVILSCAQKGCAIAVKMWNDIHPETQIIAPKSGPAIQRYESLMEDYVMELYRDFHPRRQVATDFGIADIVHDHGVVEIKEWKSIRSAHTAMGQAMSYGSILNKQPEVLLFNVPDPTIHRVVAMFTAVGMLVWMYNKDHTRDALKRKRWHPTYSNASEIQFQIAKR